MENIELKYNESLKVCKTVDEVKTLVREFYNNVEFPEIRTKRKGFVVNDFFSARSSLKIEYICDSDVRVRCCRIENLWKYIKFCAR